jgi:GT2 family glycosyltransferase
MHDTSVNCPFDVAVVVVCHNNRSEIGSCLQSVAELGFPVVVVDTGSRDESVAFVREAFPAVRVVEVENAGFGAAANRGVGLVTSDYVLLLNADAWPEHGGGAALIAAGERSPAAAAIGPRLVFPDGSHQRSVFGYPRDAASLAALVAWPGFVRRLHRVRQCLGRRRGARAEGEVVEVVEIGDTEFVSGAALLLRRSAFSDVGGFDHRFFMYCEEVDLCIRLRHAGWTIAFDPRSTFTHVGGASTTQEPDRMHGQLIESYLYLLAKHRGRETARRARALSLAILAIRSLVLLGERRTQARRAFRRLRTIDDFAEAGTGRSGS